MPISEKQEAPLFRGLMSRTPPPGKVFVFDHAISLKEYLRQSREDGTAFSGWRRSRASEKNMEVYSNPRFGWKVFIERNGRFYQIGIMDGEWLRYVAKERTADMARKAARITMDYASKQAEDSGWSPKRLAEWMGNWRDRSMSMAAVDSHEGVPMAWGKLRYNSSREKEAKLSDSTIRKAYSDAARGAKRKFGIRKPRLIILHGAHFYGGRYWPERNAISVCNYQKKAMLKFVLMHELSHAVAYRKFGGKGHCFEFLQVYKALSGRDYFKNQDRLLLRLKQGGLKGRK